MNSNQSFLQIIARQTLAFCLVLLGVMALLMASAAPLVLQPPEQRASLWASMQETSPSQASVTMVQTTRQSVHQSTERVSWSNWSVFDGIAAEVTTILPTRFHDDWAAIRFKVWTVLK